jgi:hypothetical protein
VRGGNTLRGAEEQSEYRLDRASRIVSLSNVTFRQLDSKPRALAHISGKEFESHKAPKVGILSFVDDTHPAAEFLDDAVVRDGLSDQFRNPNPRGRQS